MSNKLTFGEWKRRLQDECYNSDCTTDCAGCKFSVDKLSAWNFAQAQEQKEYNMLEAEHSILLAQFSKVDLERLRLEKEAQAKQAMYDEKYTEIHKANVVLMDERDIIRKENDSLWVENEDLTRKIEKLEQEVARLKKKLEKAEEVIKFYGDPEKWMIKTSDSWTKSNPRTYGDSELIEDYSHPNKDWVGSIVVGGKKARAYLKENI